MWFSDILGQVSWLLYLGRPSSEFHDIYLILKDFACPLKCNHQFAWKQSLHLPACCALKAVLNYSFVVKELFNLSLEDVFAKVGQA